MSVHDSVFGLDQEDMMAQSDAGEGTSDLPSTPLLSPEQPAGQATTSTTSSSPAFPSEAQPAAGHESRAPIKKPDRLLFQRFQKILKSGQCSLDVEDVMSYELCSFPATLFEAKEILRKANKPDLVKALVTEHKSRTSKPVHYVLDGGSLVHRLEWVKGVSYGDIAKSYADFTKENYGTATVVFDGYSDRPSTKDNTHQRRGANTHHIVEFNAETKFEGKQDNFLSSSSNKKELINLMKTELEEKGCTVMIASDDADVDIVKAAVKASEEQPTILIGEDTDLLILLLYYAGMHNRGLRFRSDKSKATEVYNISEMKQVLGKDLCSQLLFIHAFTGCDTTSSIYYVTKQTAFKKLLNGESTMLSCANVFLSPNQQSNVIEDHGTKAMAVLFGGRSTDSLASLRHQKVVAAKTIFTLERLPPTESSTKYHCQRVYFQIMVWIGMEGDMKPINWGWKEEDNRLLPVMSSKTAAPEGLMQMLYN